MSKKHDATDVTSCDAEIRKVLKHQEAQSSELNARIKGVKGGIEESIASSEDILRSLKIPLPDSAKFTSGKPELPSLRVRPWAEISREAEAAINYEVGLSDLLTGEEFDQTLNRIAVLRGEFDAEHRLDGIDWAISGVAGSIAALVDTFLVKMPSSPGLLGGEKIQGGGVSDYIRDRLKTAYSPEQIREMEQKYWVPYDAAHSANLVEEVSGLGPRTHRFQSLGHDPILGFLFGVSDILRGRMTAVDKSGHLISQLVVTPDAGMSLFDAIAQQFGHLKSDISTKAGLPAPLMPLLQFLQVGKFGKGEHTIGEISRLMYAKGYDFGHFLAMSVPVLIIEVLVRIAYCVKRLAEGHTLMESLPFNLPGKPRQPKLQTMLFVAHLIATSVNGGRAYLTSNPLAINYPQWVMFAKSSLSQLKWVLIEKEAERLSFVQSRIDNEWEILNMDLAKWWEQSEVPRDPLLLS